MKEIKMPHDFDLKSCGQTADKETSAVFFFAENANRKAGFVRGLARRPSSDGAFNLTGLLPK